MASKKPTEQTEQTASTEPAATTLHRSRSASRVLGLLDSVVMSGSATLTDAAQAVDLPASSALRHLRVLTDLGYLVKDEVGRYSVGPSFVRLALASFQSGPYARLAAAAQPSLERLAEVTEESAYLAVRDGTEAVYVATVESGRAIRHVGWVGRSVPIVGTAVGDALTSGSGVGSSGPKVFRNSGAIESDVSAVVAPVYGSGGVVAAISVLGPLERLRGDRMDVAADLVLDEAAKVTAAMAMRDNDR